MYRVNKQALNKASLKLIYVFPGSEFDMMSRKVIAASSMPVAKRIAQVVRAFPCTRDDEDPARVNNGGHCISSGL